jgi:tubulin monoglycylase TTLL15
MVVKKINDEKRGKEKINFKFFVFAAILTAFLATIYALSTKSFKIKFLASKIDSSNLKFWPVEDFDTWNPRGSMTTMKKVFKKMDFQFVNGTVGDEWDICWSMDYPYQSTGVNLKVYAGLESKILEKHQKFNHFPGNINLISKADMAENNKDSKYILRSFLIPEDIAALKTYIKENPKKRVLEKNLYNRGVRIIKTKDIKTETKDEVYYQEFMDNPFLIDGHALDFGVFVLVSSFNPIRVYRFANEVLLRFCEEKYHPFDAKNTNKYVVKDGSIPPYEMPSFKANYEKYKFPLKVLFENYIETRGFNVKEFWARIDDAIASIVMNSENRVIQEVIK